MAKLKATFHVKKDIGYDELEITTSADGVTYGGGTSGLSATDVQGAIDEVVTETNVALNAKQATITGGATTIATSNLTANKALISDANGKVSTSATSNTELGYLSGVTSAVQTQLNAKQGKVANVDDTEIGYLNGVTSNIQSQLDNKIKYIVGDTVNFEVGMGTNYPLPFSGTLISTVLIIGSERYYQTNKANISTNGGFYFTSSNTGSAFTGKVGFYYY